MLNSILHKIAAALGTAAGYLDLDTFLALVKQMLMLSAMLGVAYVLYAMFYLNEPLVAFLERFLRQIMMSTG